MAIEIVDIPINSMVIFHSKLLVFQRVWDSLGVGISSLVFRELKHLASEVQK